MDVESRSSTISWEASTDSDGIDFYEVYLDGEMVDTTEELSYTFTDLGLDLEYTAEVYAVDTLGARSLATSEAFVLASTTEATPEAPDTGLLNLFENLTTTLATSAAGVLSTGAILVFGRKFF